MATSVLLVSLYTTSCYKDVTVPGEKEITRDVSFSADIIPILNKSCNNIGCHGAGGVPPNLTAGNAYSALISGGYTNTASPENSELYQWMKGNRTIPMPPTGADPDYNALVLAWIKQGALDN